MTLAALHAATEIAGWMNPDELMWLGSQAIDASIIVEVGAWKGRSTLALAAHTAGVVYAVDHWRGCDPAHLEEIRDRGADSVFDDFSRNLAGYIASGRVKPRRMDSARAAVRLAALGVRPDFVFLDGDHHEAALRRDIECYSEILRAGGLLAGHDYGNPEHPGVKRAVDDVFPEAKRAAFSIWWVRL